MLVREIDSFWSLFKNYISYFSLSDLEWFNILSFATYFGYILFFVTIILFAVGNKNLLSKKKMALLLAAEQELEDDEQEDESEDEEDCLYEEE